ncbi:MFS transporter [Clostridium estertheticum]|uniref:MFS transporter n=1 Tax=Clostridium estertheticum TaxID=238834 RepID=UPI001CF2C5FC|nr:MFS transporter [Clostridium estertheticum]MCB2360625.1 MFS transporter [Clostridium estertheticum]
MKNKIFTRNELLFLITISLALGIRQMAMTIVMPFISTYSRTLSYSNATLAGVALGIFGLTQAIFQIPFGIWSDKIGNKRVILIGLLQVIIGLVIAFLGKSIYMLIFARALQGSGAILASGYSWLICSVDNKKRPRALSILGMIVGFFAASAFALGPLINNYISVRQMFLVCALLISLVWIIILFFLKETNDESSCAIPQNQNKIGEGIKVLLRNKKFLGLNLAGFLNNYIMVSVFYIVPIYLEKITGASGMWKIFMPAVIIAIIFMKKSIIFLEKGSSSNLIMLAFILSAMGILFYFKNQSFYFILIGSILFMTGYILLATVIPSAANDIAENSYRGMANGIINSFQYIGSFVGSVITGLLWSNHKNIALFLIIAICIMGLFTVKKTNRGSFKKINLG